MKNIKYNKSLLEVKTLEGQFKGSQGFFVQITREEINDKGDSHRIVDCLRREEIEAFLQDAIKFRVKSNEI